MRRDDEAFKNEVFRRYGVQKRNRRNYFILALSPLVLAIILGSLIFMPYLSGLLNLTPADDPEGTMTTTTVNDPPKPIPQEHPLDRYLDLPISRIAHRLDVDQTAEVYYQNDAEINEIVTKLKKLTLSEIPVIDLWCEGPRLLIAFEDQTSIQLQFDIHGYMELRQYDAVGEFLKLQWYEIPAHEVAALTESLKKLMDSEPAHPLAGYLNQTISNIKLLESANTSSAYTYAAEKEINSIITELLKLNMTKISHIELDAYGPMIEVVYPSSAPFHDGSSRLLLELDPTGYILLNYYHDDVLEKSGWYQVPVDELAALTEYLESLMDEEVPPVDPPTVPTLSDFLAKDVDQISVYAQFGADQRYDAKDGTNNWFATLMENLRACQFQACAPSVNAANAGKPTIVLTKDGYSLYLLLNDKTDSIITYLYDSTGNLVDTGHYRTDNDLSFGRTISWANSSMLSGNINVSEASALRKILSEKIKAASFRLYALQDATFTCQNAEDLQKILDCIWKMSFTEIPAVNLTCMGSVVTFTMEDGRTATLSFDDTGYLHLLIKDAGGKTITSQWYEFALKPNASGILSCLSNLHDRPPASVYPTPGTLYTELYPYAGILNLYPEYLSTYTQPSDYEIGEIMRRIHKLKLTECNETPDYVFNQPTLEFWFSNCVFRIIVDGKNGYLRTFVEEFDETTLLEAKLYKGSVQEIAALAAYLDELTPPPYVEEVHIAPLDTFRAFLNQEIASLKLSVNNQSYLPFEYTDAKVISAVMEKIKALSLTNKQEATSIGDSPNSSYVNIDFANGNSMMLIFDTSGYVYYRFQDEKSDVIYSGKYRLSAAEVSAFAKFIDPYLDAEPSDEVPLMKDLLDNTALQNFLAGVGVTVNTTPEEAPREIERMLADHGGAVGGFFADGQSFTSPDGVNLDYMLYDYYGSDRSPLSDAERLALVKAGVHPEFVGHSDFSRFTLEEIRGILEDNLAYLPAFADNLHEELLKCTVYAPETDCYYQFHTDYLGRISGENARLYRTNRADTVIVLFSDDFYDDLHVAAFRIVNGEYRLYGYTPI